MPCGRFPCQRIFQRCDKEYLHILRIFFQLHFFMLTCSPSCSHAHKLAHLLTYLLPPTPIKPIDQKDQMLLPYANIAKTLVPST